MKSFEERRKEYFEKLKKYENHVIKLSKEDKNKKLVEILLFPKDEEELNMANVYVIFIQDSIELTANAMCGYVEKIDLKNSAFVEYISTVINLIYNNASADKIKETIASYINNPKLLAEVIYQAYVIAINQADDLIEIINDKCGINIDSELEMMRFSLLLNQAMEKVNSCLNIDKSEDKNNFDEIISIFKSYHELCVKGIKQNSNPEVAEIINESLGSGTDLGKQKIM